MSLSDALAALSVLIAPAVYVAGLALYLKIRSHRDC